MLPFTRAHAVELLDGFRQRPFRSGRQRRLAVIGLRPIAQRHGLWKPEHVAGCQRAGHDAAFPCAVQRGCESFNHRLVDLDVDDRRLSRLQRHRYFYAPPRDPLLNDRPEPWLD